MSDSYLRGTLALHISRFAPRGGLAFEPKKPLGAYDPYDMGHIRSRSKADSVFQSFELDFEIWTAAASASDPRWRAGHTNVLPRRCVVMAE